MSQCSLTCSELSLRWTSLSTRSRNFTFANFSSVISMDFLQNFGWNFGAVAAAIFKKKGISITEDGRRVVLVRSVSPCGHFPLFFSQFVVADEENFRTFFADLLFLLLLIIPFLFVGQNLILSDNKWFQFILSVEWL